MDIRIFKPDGSAFHILDDRNSTWPARQKISLNAVTQDLDKISCSIIVYKLLRHPPQNREMSIWNAYR